MTGERENHELADHYLVAAASEGSTDRRSAEAAVGQGYALLAIADAIEQLRDTVLSQAADRTKPEPRPLTMDGALAIVSDLADGERLSPSTPLAVIRQATREAREAASQAVNPEYLSDFARAWQVMRNRWPDL